MILAALLFVAAAPNAEPEPDCTSDDLPQQEMNYCAAQDFRAADAELNAQWTITAEAMKQMDESETPDDGRPGYYQTLLDGQRGWLRYRDGQCDSEGYAFRGGSMEPFIVGGCRTRLTKARIQELRELVATED